MKDRIPVDERLEQLNYRAAHRAFVVMNILLIIYFFFLHFITDNLLIIFPAFAIWFTGSIIYEVKSQEYGEYRLKHLFSDRVLLRKSAIKQVIAAPFIGFLMFSLQYWGAKQSFRSALFFAIIMTVCMPLLTWRLEKREARKIIEKERAGEEADA